MRILSFQIRNGLGQFGMGHRNFTHSFDAFGKLSSWKFPGNGSAFFSTKFIQSDFYKASVSANDIEPWLMFESVTPPFDEIQKLHALIRGIDNMNVNIAKLNSDGGATFVALNDFWKIYEIDPYSLSTTRSLTANVPQGGKTGSVTFLNFLSSAHPLPEYGTGNHITFLSSVSLIPGIKSKITTVRIRTADKREEIAHWEVDRVPYMHSFSVTQNYVIFFASPFYVNVMKMIRYAEPFNCLDWNKNEVTTVYVVEIKTGKVYTMKTENMFTMHHINAFESGKREITVDVSSYPSPQFVKDLQMKILLDPIERNNFDAHALLKRYHIDIDRKEVTAVSFPVSKTVPFANKLDMPTINENYRYQNYCYIYGVVLKSDDTNLSHISLVKKDICNASGDKSWFIKHHYPVEAWFVGAPSAKEEDDGYLLVPILDGKNKTSYLSIIDTKTMKTVNRAELPTIVPFNLHGRFFEDVV
ncbi:hypothetical protein FSP39_003754 [Pinctada imbricata]|uniref:Uncharacterized protein n=1 Tax=Pinctada imbricata TaxID=66713 RepID=A0AA89C6E5_PINIB|nr:hypothetical protein FSP39_003754 [Pinctada imbricata]